MNNNRRHSEASERFAERRRREDEATRLAVEVPRLATLKLEVQERNEGGVVGVEPAYVRRIVIERAPALFFLACGDSRCKDGGHDITRSVMQALRSGQTRFEGNDECNGSQGSSQCHRILHYVGVATYS